MAIQLEEIKIHQPKIIGENSIFKAAVCIPLIQTEDGFNLLFQVRSNKLDKQPGDICFPGGKIENGESPKEAALREIYEELLIDEKQFQIIGENDFLHMDNMIVYPFIGILKDYDHTYNEEVDHVFQVPLSFFEQNPLEKHIIDYIPSFQENFPFEKIVSGKNYKWRSRKITQYFYTYDHYCIWGLTARIIHNFINTFSK